MIAAIPVLWRYLGGALVVLLLLGGIYLKGRSDGKAVVQAVLDEQRAVWQTGYNRQVAETHAKEAQWAARLKEVEDDLQVKMVAAESSVGGLTRRLRLATASAGKCALREDPSAAGDDNEGEGPVSEGVEEIERDSDATWAAAARAATALDACIDAYEALR